MVGHVVLGVVCRTVGLRVGIDAEYGVVAGLSRPHPVVGLASELAHRLGDGEDKTQVAELTVGCRVVLVAFVERLHFEFELRVFLVCLLDEFVLHFGEQFLALCVVHVVYSALLEHGCDVLLFHHEAHEHSLVGELFFERFGVESVEHVVVLHCGV